MSDCTQSDPPYAYGGDDNPCSAGSAHSPNGAVQILLVEDDVLMRRACEVGLSRKGYKVSVAEDPEHGWECLRSKPFDLLVTDHHMPRLSGLELIRRMRSEKIRVPSLLMSGDFPEDAADACRTLEPVDLLEKPFDMHHFIACVENLLRGKAF